MKKEEKIAYITSLGIIIAALIGAVPIIADIFLDNSNERVKYEELLEKYEELEQEYLYKQLDLEFSSTEELLNLANNYYKKGDYINAAFIYKSEQLKNNSIALNNLAYIYLYKFDSKEYIYDAKECLYSAKNLDFKYFEAYFSILIQCPESYQEIINILNLGHKNNIQLTDRFLYNCIEQSVNTNNLTIDDFFNMNYENQKEILQVCLESEEYVCIQEAIPSMYKINEFNTIIQNETKRILVGSYQYNNSLETDQLYGNVNVIHISHLKFNNEYIVLGNIKYEDVKF